MRNAKTILSLLAGGDRRTIGAADKVAAMVSKDLTLFSGLIGGLWSEDALIRMRAADAVEKVTRKHRALLWPYKRELLGLMKTAEQQELRWHLAAMVPRLFFSETEREIAVAELKRYLDDRSSIVQTFALQGLADMAEAHPAMRAEVIEILHAATREGTPAMKARARKLLVRLGRP
jgi:hypothetical protein